MSYYHVHYGGNCVVIVRNRRRAVSILWAARIEHPDAEMVTILGPFGFCGRQGD